jgi:hypothetical protein
MDRVPASEAGSGSSSLPGDAMNHSQKFPSKFLFGFMAQPGGIFVSGSCPVPEEPEGRRMVQGEKQTIKYVLLQDLMKILS